MPTNFPAYIQDQASRDAASRVRERPSQSVPRVMSKSMTCEGVCVCMCTRVTRAHSTKEWFTFEISHSKGVWCSPNRSQGMGGRGLPR